MFQYHVYGIILLALNGAFAVTVNSKCAPTCEGVTESFTAVMDPSSCLGYYVCAFIGDEFILSDRLECNEGYYFNTDLVPPQCDQISGAHEGFCDGYCNPCEAQCSVPSSLRPDPLDCGKYYLCLENDVATSFPCTEPTQYFDYIAEECQTDASKCYDYCNKATTYCTEPGFVVALEPECAQHYSYCDPPTLIPFSCEDGECFNVDDEICE